MLGRRRIRSRHGPWSIAMTSSCEIVTPEQATRLLAFGEGQFYDLESIDSDLARLMHRVSAFANSEGGDLYIGIDKAGTDQRPAWRGFATADDASEYLQAIGPHLPPCSDCECLKCDARPGIVLHIQINKTKGIKYSSNNIAYVRRGALSLRIEDEQQLAELKSCKGVASFETEAVNVPLDTISKSAAFLRFFADVFPTTTPEKWLRQQTLVRDGLPTVAAVLLFSDAPQAAMPNYWGIKVHRYKTTGDHGYREDFALGLQTVTGPLERQIREAVRLTCEAAACVPTGGTTALECVKYPTKTLHELITNAVVHRDYSIADHVHIRIFDDRVEIQSPGRLPAHVTAENMLDERFARNSNIVRVLNRFADPPNKGAGEGLKTAASAMRRFGLKPPVVQENGLSVIVAVTQEPLALPEEAIRNYLQTHETINNSKAREITCINAEQRIKTILKRMVASRTIEQVPGTKTRSTAYRLPAAGRQGAAGRVRSAPSRSTSIVNSN